MSAPAIAQPCSCRACAEMADFFTLDGPQLSFIAVGGLSLPEPAFPDPDAPTAVTAGVSDPKPHRRGRTLAAPATGDVR